MWYKEKFRTQTSAKNAIRNIINNQSLNIPFEGDDEKFLLWVLKNHYQWKIKSENYSKIVVKINRHKYGNSRGLHILKTDGTSIDISWIVCFLSEKQRLEQDFNAALRFEIEDQRDDLSLREGSDFFCDLCKQKIEKYSETHRDHVVKFLDIVNDWKKIENINSPLDTMDIGDGLHVKLVNREIANRWKDYHKKRAIFRVVHKKCNLKRK